MSRKEYFFLFVLFFLTALGVYHSGLSIPYFGDDFQLVFVNPRDAIFHDFFQPNPINLFYRPLQTMLLGLLQTYWGWETLPIRIINLLFHSATALIVYHALRHWKLSSVASFGAALFLLVSQSSAAVVLGNDTISQASGTFFSVLFLWLMYSYHSNNDSERKRSTYYWSLIAFFLAVLSKETSVGLILAIPFLLYVLQPQGVFFQRAKVTIIHALPYAGCFIIYFLLRQNAAAINPAAGTSTYQFILGWNIPKNIGLFSLQSILPVSSVAVLRSMHYKEYAVLIGYAVFTMLFAIVLFYGLWRSSRKGIIGALLVLGVCSWFPVLPMALVGELYVGNMIPYVAALVGISFEYYWITVRQKSHLVFWSMATMFIAVIISNAIATNEKSAGMKVLGDRAVVLMPQAVEAAKTVPPKAMLYLVNPPGDYFDYSLFSLRGFRVITSADTVIKTLAHRPDIEIRIKDSDECARLSKEYPGVGFTYDTATMKVYPMKANFGLQPIVKEQGR